MKNENQCGARPTPNLLVFNLISRIRYVFFFCVSNDLFVIFCYFLVFLTVGSGNFRSLLEFVEVAGTQPIEAVVSATEAVTMLEKNPGGVVAISHSWLSAGHPDPHGERRKASLQETTPNMPNPHHAKTPKQ